MKTTVRLVMAVLTGLALTWPSPATAVTDADKCQADKLKRAGQYNVCRLKADGKGIKKGDPPDYTKCDEKIAEKFSAAETKYGAECPTSGDVTNIQSQATADADFIALKLAGERFADNGDGTVIDTETGLQWEKKTDDSGIHDKDNTYTWSTGSSYGPTGTAFTTFLGTLNNGTSSDGNTISGCFANHCDWRLPTSAELQTILLAPYPCGTSPCIDAAFGSTVASFYWSSTTYSGGPYSAWGVFFSVGNVGGFFKTFLYYVRAVRGGL